MNAVCLHLITITLRGWCLPFSVRLNIQHDNFKTNAHNTCCNTSDGQTCSCSLVMYYNLLSQWVYQIIHKSDQLGF